MNFLRIERCMYLFIEVLSSVSLECNLFHSLSSSLRRLTGKNWMEWNLWVQHSCRFSNPLIWWFAGFWLICVYVLCMLFLGWLGTSAWLKTDRWNIHQIRVTILYIKSPAALFLFLLKTGISDMFRFTTKSTDAVNDDGLYGQECSVLSLRSLTERLK